MRKKLSPWQSSACVIEEHYSKKRGRPTPMDIEWAKDGITGELFIVQARPETVQSQCISAKSGNLRIEDDAAKCSSPAEASENGSDRETCASSQPPLISNVPCGRGLGDRQDRSGLGADDEEGGGDRHKPRRPDVPCRHRQPRAGHSRNRRDGAGNSGAAGRTAGYGRMLRRRNRHEFMPACCRSTCGRWPWKTLQRPRTKIMLNVGNPEEAFRLSMIPNDGVGLARGIHHLRPTSRSIPWPCCTTTGSQTLRRVRRSNRITAGYADKPQYFVDKLAEGVAMIAAAFYPKDVIVRLSDFKTNEYANLIGGREFEPVEENPMLGFRGASRYYHPRYRDGFALECRAMKKVRNEMGLSNVKLMVPFCRTVEEGGRVIDGIGEERSETGGGRPRGLRHVRDPQQCNSG